MDKIQIHISNIAIALVLIGPGCARPDKSTETTSERPSDSQPSAVAELETVSSPAEQLPNGRMSETGILTGGQPSQVQLAAAAENGIRTVINLRTEGERGNTDRSFVESLGLTYVEIPIEGAEALTEENARLLATALDEAEAPIMVHCGSGNRVGALFAMKAYYVDGRPAEEAIVVGQEAGMTRLEPVVREKLGLPGS